MHHQSNCQQTVILNRYSTYELTDSADFNYYRPISILPLFNALFRKFIYARLDSFGIDRRLVPTRRIFFLFLPWLPRHFYLVVIEQQQHQHGSWTEQAVPTH